MRLKPLNVENVIAYFDEESKIGIVSYEGVVTPQAMVGFYKWLDASYESVPPAEYRGSIFDFRFVIDFNKDNMMAAQSAAKLVQRNHDLSQIPVAFIVSTHEQEEVVRISMLVTPQQPHKRIVRSTEAAYDFIDSWHHANHR